MKSHFESRVYSADSVPRGKPAPDLFLYAASQMGVAPEKAIVIEDSVLGVQAARAAGMTAIALLAASHIQSDHRLRVEAAGAHYVANTYHEAKEITLKLLR